MKDITECMLPISEESFKGYIDIRFKNILQGFEEYKNSILINKFEDNYNNIENRFIGFMEAAFEINKSENADIPLIIDFYLSNLDEKAYFNLYNSLDEDDIETLERIKLNFKTKTNYFIILDKSLIPFFTRLSTRELFFITFYYISFPTTIWGNYGFKFPVFYEDDNIFRKYKKLAENNKLKL